MLQNRLFFALASRSPVLELQFPTPLRVVLLCFATQSPQIALEWLRPGVLKEVSHEMRFCRQWFSFQKSFFKSASKSSFFRSGVEIRFWSRSSIVLCNSVSADRIVMAVSRLLHAVACVIHCLLQLDFVNRIGVAAWRLRQWFLNKTSTSTRTSYAT